MQTRKIVKSQFTKYSPQYSIYNMKWTFHKTDADPKPSIPHGHYNEFRLSLDGCVYKKVAGELEYVGHVREKELNQLNNDKSLFWKQREFIRNYPHLIQIRGHLRRGQIQTFT